MSLNPQLVDLMLYVLAGLIISSIVFKIIRLAGIHTITGPVFILSGCILSIIIGYSFFPLNPYGYLTNRGIEAGVTGAIGGMVGGGLGALIGVIFEKFRGNKTGTILPAVLAVVGFFLAEVVDLGSSKLVSNAVRPNIKVVTKNPTQMTFGQFKQALLSNPLDGDIFKRFSRSNPSEMDIIIRKVFDLTKEGWKNGLRNEELASYRASELSTYSDIEMTKRSDDVLIKLIKKKILFTEEALNLMPEFCGGTIHLIIGQVPDHVSNILSTNSMRVMIDIIKSPKTSNHNKLNSADFDKFNEYIFKELIKIHGDDVAVFTGEAELTRGNARKFCRIETDFMKIVSELDYGAYYFRTLSDFIYSQQ